MQQASEHLPDFSRNITERDFKEGCPGVEGLDEWFALGMEFQAQIKSAGYYHFELSSDNGSKLYVNGQLIIDNDGQHPVQEVAGGSELAPGIHTMQLEYFQGLHYRIALELFWTPPYRFESSYIPNTLLSRKTHWFKKLKQSYFSIVPSQADPS